PGQVKQDDNRAGHACHATTRAIELSNITRQDDLEPFEARESILEIAPDREDDFFKVPKILGS
ncbi:MAG: Asp-tRNA(Asn)/Glu-tRNA(Gln) amidotransferase subunit GatC, partial [Cyanobacteria bacterium J06636_28]